MPVDILDIHDKVDNGHVFFVSHTFESVGNNDSVYIRHVTGSEHLHSTLSLNTVGQWKFESLQGSTYSADGTVLAAINRKTDSTETFKSTFYHTPTVTAEGTPRLVYTFGAGTNPSRTDTSQLNDDLESIFEPSADVLIKLTNQSGGTQYLSAIFNVYEE